MSKTLVTLIESVVTLIMLARRHEFIAGSADALEHLQRAVKSLRDATESEA